MYDQKTEVRRTLRPVHGGIHDALAVRCSYERQSLVPDQMLVPQIVFRARVEGPGGPRLGVHNQEEILLLFLAKGKQVIYTQIPLELSQKLVLLSRVGPGFHEFLQRFFDCFRILRGGESCAMSLELLHCHNEPAPQ